MPVKMTIARIKLAMGPAATIAARFQTFWAKKLTDRSWGDMAAAAASSVIETPLASPWNLTYPPSGKAASRQ
jgi:hypothetical protein